MTNTLFYLHFKTHTQTLSLTHTMKTDLVFLTVFLFAIAGYAQELEPKWIKTNQKECIFWNSQISDAFHELTWNGGCKDGFADGQGILSFNGKSKGAGVYSIWVYSGGVTNGKLEGYGELVYNDDRFYKGNFREGLRSGHGSWRLDEQGYDGEFVNDKFHGKGKLTKWDGEMYEGDFIDGAYHGQGKVVTSDGDIYVGGFENGRYHGEGELIKANGDKLSGSFERDNLHGNGLVCFANGDTLKGIFQSGTPNEDAVYRWKNGQVFKGMYQGKWTPSYGELFENNIHVAHYTEGKRTPLEKARETFVVFKGIKYEGNLVNGALFGIGKICYENGDTLYADFINNVAFATERYVYQNGLIFSGSLVNNKPYNGRVYKNGVLLYELYDGYREGEKPETTEKEETIIKEPSAPSYRKGIATYKGLSDKDLVIEIQAEVLYRAKKDPGLFGLQYYDIAEAKGIRFRYPGNSDTWYNFGDGDSIYDCYDKNVEYTCVSIKGMVFILAAPSIY